MIGIPFTYEGFMLATLSRWNRWGGAHLKSGLIRDVTSTIYPVIKSSDIVVLIGPRRAGKTTVLFQLMDILQTENIPVEAILHINFEEPAFTPCLNLDLLDEIYKTYREEIYPDGKAYLFLDEIQNIPHWERWVRTRNETENIKIFVTGSSSKLMSRELGTLLTGRHVSFKVFPLNFVEYLRFCSIKLPKKRLPISASPQIQHALNSYLQWGGFPEVVVSTDDRRKELLLKQYFDDILFKDIALRHNIRDNMMLRNIAVHLLTQTASLVSFQRISKMFGVSLELAQSYCHYLQEAFMVDFLPFYSLKAAERNRHPQKVHALDLGLRKVVMLSASPDYGRMIETAIYHHLMQQHFDGIFYGKKNGEVDFLVRFGNKLVSAIQAVYEGLDKDSIWERESSVFSDITQGLKKAKKMIVTNQMPNKMIIEKAKDISILPLWYFLTEK